jgi:hypothetical protein
MTSSARPCLAILGVLFLDAAGASPSRLEPRPRSRTRRSTNASGRRSRSPTRTPSRCRTATPRRRSARRAARATCSRSSTTTGTTAGAVPGTVGLTVVSGLGGAGSVIGPLPAPATTDRTASRTPTGPAPRRRRPARHHGYSCLDSDPATWSQNSKRRQGFCTLTVKRAIKAKPRSRRRRRTPAPDRGHPVRQLELPRRRERRQAARFFTATTPPGASAGASTRSARTTPTTAPARRREDRAPASSITSARPPCPCRCSSDRQRRTGRHPERQLDGRLSLEQPRDHQRRLFLRRLGPGTWAQNALSGGKGFCTVYATPAYVTNFTLPTGFSVRSRRRPRLPRRRRLAERTELQRTPTVCRSSSRTTSRREPDDGPARVRHQAANSFTGALTPRAVRSPSPPAIAWPAFLRRLPLHHLWHGTWAGESNFCPNSIQSIPWSVVPGIRGAADHRAVDAGRYLVFVRTVRGDSERPSVLNVP